MHGDVAPPQIGGYVGDALRASRVHKNLEINKKIYCILENAGRAGARPLLFVMTGFWEVYYI